jgi:hypothetical protein
MTELPTSIKILDVTYTIEYVDKPSDVDIFKRRALWGQCDFWTRTIRVYRDNRQPEDVWQTLWHEIFHAICEKLDLEKREIGRLNDDEHLIDLLATGINSVLFDNRFIEAGHDKKQ